ncbi:hypothetical protein MYX64_08205 [Nitrospinae bacterium AH_259_B05_G02_I21]|nr:hypothetical protein [Nitrospinae bacterium AH_259_B05_G02_I21]
MRFMTADTTLQIGDSRICFRPTSPEATCRFISPYDSFLGGGTPDVILDVHRGPPPLLSNSFLCFDTGTTWCMVKANGLVAIYGCSYDALQERNNIGLVMAPDFTRGNLYVLRPESRGRPYLENPLGYPLDQILTIQLLAQGRGLLLHACAVLDEGRGYCFAGVSGRGKSTMAGLWDGEATILNDDRIILRPRDNGFWMYGTPWHGTYPATSPEGCPVNELFLLAHGPENTLRRLPPAEAACRLLQTSFPPLWDHEGMAWTLEFLDQLTTSVPVYELTFRPDEAVVPFVRHAARG